MRSQVGMTLRLRQELRQRLTYEQRCILVERIFSRRLALIGALRDGTYSPRGACPRCERVLKPLEIISGFNRDPQDYTTRCTGCSHRFEPQLVCALGRSRVELAFYCPSQTLAQMRGL